MSRFRKLRDFFGASVDFWLSACLDERRRSVVANTVRRWMDNTSPVVLDVGCGTGIAAEVLVRMGYPQQNLILLDISEEMLCAARSRLPGAAFVCAAGEVLPIADGCCERIILFCSLPHLSLEEFLGEARRVCRPGAEMLILHDSCHVEVNEIHRSAGEPVSEDTLPPPSALAERLGKFGFEPVVVQEEPGRLYLLIARLLGKE